MDSSKNFLFDLRARGDWVRLRTLVVLRWIAITGQSATVLIAMQVLDFQLPLPQCALVISASVCFNTAALLAHPGDRRLSERGTLFSLLFDLVQLVVLLMLTGGLNNPFAALLLAPVTISATALTLRSTLILGAAALLSIPLLAMGSLPLLHQDGAALTVPPLYTLGYSAALAIGVLFLSIYARRVTAEIHAMSEALNATQVALGREQRLSAIGGIAAAVAHELGTPLATIKLVAAELARELESQPHLAEDAALIRQEAERCGAILADLGRSQRDDRYVKHAPIGSVIEEAAEPHLDRGKHVVIRVDGIPLAEADPDPHSIARSPEFIHGLRNVIQNAVDFASDTVWVDAEVDDSIVRITVGDDGAGFGPDILPRLGEPYVSTRSRDLRRPPLDSAYEGLGLGVFIARTLLERTGATLSFANGSDSLSPAQTMVGDDRESMYPTGAIIEMVWNRAALIVDKATVRRPLGPRDLVLSHNDT